MSKETMRATVDAFYSQVLNAGNAELFSDLVADEYIQHNPLFANGPEPLIGYIQEVGNLPCEVKRIAIDNDLAFAHVRYLNWNGSEHAGVDIFRFDDDGKIAEHWDVLQPVASETANENTMF